MEKKEIVLRENENVTLTVYLQAVGQGEFASVPKRPAILIMPGGGYFYCSDREADPVAMPYLKAGYQVFILRYSVSEGTEWPKPLEDYESAMEIICANAEKWGVYQDRIAVIGFSAGGHLAAAAATMGKHRPAAAILGYALINDDVKGFLKSAPNVAEAVDDQTPPCFLFACRTDNIVPISNSLDFMAALAKKGISFESHIYAYGPHGFSTCDNSVQDREINICGRVQNWVEDSISWLEDVLGVFCLGGMTEGKCKRHINGDYERFLSVNCTMGCLMRNPEANELLSEFMAGFQQTVRRDQLEQRAGQAGMTPMITSMKLCDALAYGKIPKSIIDELDAKLCAIPNV